MTAEQPIKPASVEKNLGDFSDWDALLALLKSSFAYMEDRIDPPSSLHRLDPKTIQEKAATEELFFIKNKGKLVACAFMDDRGDHYYLGKVATDPSLQGSGLGHEMLEACINHAKSQKKSYIELQVRVELVENQRFFEKRGFVKSGETAHVGYDRPTSYTFRLDL
ncbi:GNAT family N-acetyltransferase [Sneathiella limimaris]|uniref:GNAT family N-acetyltransferase n=1 Tax=Sneathiella limimaris TaxID=1964213 RepID=UPI00146C711D|nr:GNAT family N-acetyltransferase [Sneathiella limimaris]